MIDNLKEKLKGTIPVTRKELFELVSSWGRNDDFSTFDEINVYKCKPKECYPLENLDVSQIKNMSDIFSWLNFNGDLSKWDVSNVKYMQNMFERSYFNNDSLNSWNTSNVINMEFLFYESKINQDLNNWNVSSCINMSFMFCESNFNNDSLKDWDVSKVEIMDFMFYHSLFNGDISNWNISNVINFESCFDNCPFNGDISKWKFNEDSNCYYLFLDNNHFINKYNAGDNIPNDSKGFLKWFEKNRTQIASLNITKEEILDINNYLDNFEKKELKNDR